MNRSPFAEALGRARALLHDAAVDPADRQSYAAVLAEIERAQAHAPPSSTPQDGNKTTGSGGAVKHDLLAVICHDLRAPLSSVLMGAGFLQKSLGTDPKSEPMRKIADAIARSGERMNQLVRDLHDLTHMEQGRFTIERHRHGAGALLDAAYERFNPLATAKSVKLEKQNDAGGIELECDRDRVLQALSKIFDNAVRYTQAGGTIRLAARPEGGGVTLSLSDTGRGMDADRLAHAFDRAWHAAQSPREGTGLGLALARGVVLAHQGHIEVDSKPGVGTTVTFTIPRNT